jgi:hypothetical protein
MKTVALALAVAFATTAAADAATLFRAPVFSGLQETTPNPSTGTGMGWAKLSDDETTLDVYMEWDGLIGGPAAAGHIHCCSALGGNGPVALDLEPNPVVSGSSFNVFDLDDIATYGGGFLAQNGGTAASAKAALLAALYSGRAYFNVHNQTYPAGEIRGQITIVPEAGTWAMLIAGFGVVGAAARRRRLAQA